MPTWTERYTELHEILELEHIRAVLLDEAAYRGVADPVDAAALLDLALDLASKQSDTSQADLQELFDALARISELSLCLEDFKIFSTLVKEPQSQVALARCLSAAKDRVWVIKSVQKRWCASMVGQTSPMHERDILLLATQACRPDFPKLLAALQDHADLHICIEYAPLGTMWDAMENSPDNKLGEDLVSTWMVQAGEAIHWLHSLGYAHRDIKPHNFLVKENKHLQLADFGSAAPLMQREDGSTHFPPQYSACVVGTIDYIAPEVLLAHQEALMTVDQDDDATAFDTPNQSVDWWALAVVAYEALIGEAPFFARAVSVTYENIIGYEKHIKKLLPKAPISIAAKAFLQSCLTRASKRPPWEVLRDCSFLQLASESSAKLYEPSPVLQTRFIEDALSPSRTLSMPKAFDFSAFFSSPGLSALRSQQTSHLPTSEQWIGFTYLPHPEEMNDPVFRNAALARTVEGSPAHVNRFLTPARPPSRSTTTKSSTSVGMMSTKKRRPLSDLEAFHEVLECGVLSVRRRQSRTPSNPFSNSISTLNHSALTARQSTITARQTPRSNVHIDISDTPSSRASPALSSTQTGKETSSPQADKNDMPQTMPDGMAEATRIGNVGEGDDEVRQPLSASDFRQRHTGLLERCDELEETYEKLFKLALSGSHPRANNGSP